MGLAGRFKANEAAPDRWQPYPEFAAVFEALGASRLQAEVGLLFCLGASFPDMARATDSTRGEVSRVVDQVEGLLTRVVPGCRYRAQSWARAFLLRLRARRKGRGGRHTRFDELDRFPVWRHTGQSAPRAVTLCRVVPDDDRLESTPDETELLYEIAATMRRLEHVYEVIVWRGLTEAEGQLLVRYVGYRAPLADLAAQRRCSLSAAARALNDLEERLGPYAVLITRRDEEEAGVETDDGRLLAATRE